MDKGKILMLNGVSSAGKTTLARTLQDTLSQHWYLMGNDTFFDMLPQTFCNEDWPEAECQALEMLARTAKLFSDNGCNVILDTVFLTVMKRDCFAFLREALTGYPLRMVHVTCPADELARRERARGDRNIGQAVWQLDKLVPQEGYALTIDTYAHAPSENAESITRFFQLEG